jgi:microcystin-dependent protein
MATPFIAEIRLVPYNFPPRGNAFCNGQIIAIAQNTALFSLVGVTYGGNGTTNFALPDLRGRTPLSQGQGPGLSNYVLGQSAGAPTVTLLSTEMPAHTHAPQGNTGAGDSTAPAGKVWASSVGGRTPPPLYSTAAPNTPMSATAVAAAGGGQAHENRQPYLGLNFVIALQGVFPARN